MELLISITTWVVGVLLGAGIILTVAVGLAFLVVMFGEDKNQENQEFGFSFYKGDLDDD
jgi:hypothetical protein